MKKLLSTCAMSLTTALLLLPAVASASTILSFSNSGSSVGTVTVGSSGVASITLNSYSIGLNFYNGPAAANYFTETYNNTTGQLTLAATAAESALSGPLSNLAGTTFLTIQESTGLLTSATLPLSAFSLYSGVTSVTESAAFLTDLSLVTPVALSGQTFTVSTTSGGSVSSSVTGFTLTSTPEPSSFSLFGMALLLGVGVATRTKLSGLSKEA